MIYTVTLNPAMDKTVQAPNFKVDAVTRITSVRYDAGGKGINVSKVLAQLGSSSKAIAILAGNTGQAIQERLVADGIDCLPFMAEGETRTNLKVIDPVANTHTDINEPGPQISQAFLDDVLHELCTLIHAGDIVVLSGSAPANCTDDIYQVWAQQVQAQGARVFLDVDGAKLASGLKAKPFLVKPNEVELGTILGRELTCDEEVAQAARQLVDDGVACVVVSMGAAGAICATRQKTLKGIAPKVKVGSTVGAGDSVVAALAYAFERDYSLEESLRLAMACGAANVMEQGTQAAKKSAVDALIDKVEINEL